MHSEEMERKVEFELMKKRALWSGEEEGTPGWRELWMKEQMRRLKCQGVNTTRKTLGHLS